MLFQHPLEIRLAHGPPAVGLLGLAKLGQDSIRALAHIDPRAKLAPQHQGSVPGPRRLDYRGQRAGLTLVA